MTLVRSGAGDGVRAYARPGLANVRPRARVTVIAGGSVRLRRVRAQTRHPVANTRCMTLVGRHARHRRTGAHAGGAAVRPGARIPVVARGTVRLRGRSGAKPG